MPIAVRGLRLACAVLQDDTDGLADKWPQKILRHLRRQCARGSGALGANLRRHGIRHRSRRRAAALGVRKDVHGRKGTGFEKIHRLCKFLLGLTGEAGNHIRRDGTSGKCRTQPLDNGEKLRGRIAAVHTAQRRITAGLQRQMKMPREIGKSAQTAAKFVGNQARLQRAEAKPHIRCSFAQLLYEVDEILLVRQIAPVAGDFNAGHDNFPHTGRGELLRLLDGFRERQRAHMAARIRNDAVGTVVVAAVLYLEQGAGVSR